MISHALIPQNQKDSSFRFAGAEKIILQSSFTDKPQSFYKACRPQWLGRRVAAWESGIVRTPGERFSPALPSIRARCHTPWVPRSSHDLQGVSGFVTTLSPPLTLDRVVQSWCPFNWWTSTLLGLFWGIMMLGTWPNDFRTGGELTKLSF